MAAFRSLLAVLALLSVKVLADCVSYGIDYANGGAYYIDGSSPQYFTFITVFQGGSCADPQVCGCRLLILPQDAIKIALTPSWLAPMRANMPAPRSTLSPAALR